MQLIDTTAEWELRELQAFTSTLIGQSHVTAESNPFRPLVYATALWDARLRHRRLADPARDRPAHLGRRCRRPAEERRRGGVDAARIAGRPAGPVSHRRAAVGIELRPSGRRAAAPGRAERPARPACRDAAAAPARRRRRTAAASSGGISAGRRAQRRRARGEAPSSSRRCCGSTSCFATRRSRPRTRESERRASGSRSTARPCSRARASPSIDR